MMKKTVLSGMIAAALLTGGCQTLFKAKNEAPAKVEAKKIEKVGEDLLKPFFSGDADAFITALPEPLRKDFGKKDYEATRKSMLEKLGEPKSYTYLFNLDHPVAVISVWKLRFERESSDKTRKIVQETLFRAVYAPMDGKLVLLNFNFI